MNTGSRVLRPFPRKRSRNVSISNALGPTFTLSATGWPDPVRVPLTAMVHCPDCVTGVDGHRRPADGEVLPDLHEAHVLGAAVGHLLHQVRRGAADGHLRPARGRR